MVPEAGLEPAHPCGRGILNPLRLPISPLWQVYEENESFSGRAV
jgi:hypothetical protein